MLKQNVFLRPSSQPHGIDSCLPRYPAVHLLVVEGSDQQFRSSSTSLVNTRAELSFSSS